MLARRVMQYYINSYAISQMVSSAMEIKQRGEWVERTLVGRHAVVGMVREQLW